MLLFAAMSYDSPNMVESPTLNSDPSNPKNIRNKLFEGRSSISESLKGMYKLMCLQVRMPTTLLSGHHVVQLS
jgi:hypothetical protein